MLSFLGAQGGRFPFLMMTFFSDCLTAAPFCCWPELHNLCKLRLLEDLVPEMSFLVALTVAIVAASVHLHLRLRHAGGLRYLLNAIEDQLK